MIDIQSQTPLIRICCQNYGTQFNQNPCFVNNCGLQTLEINETVSPSYSQHSSLPCEPTLPPCDNIPANPPPYEEHDNSN